MKHKVAAGRCFASFLGGVCPENISVEGQIEGREQYPNSNEKRIQLPHLLDLIVTRVAAQGQLSPNTASAAISLSRSSDSPFSPNVSAPTLTTISTETFGACLRRSETRWAILLIGSSLVALDALI